MQERRGKDSWIEQMKIGTDQEFIVINTENGCSLLNVSTDVQRIYIEVTTRCNFACITCIRSSWHDELLHMEWETFLKILSSMKELPNLRSVHFGGFGEPMMHPRILEMLQAVKELGVRVEMITNGSYLSDDILDRLIELELDLIFTSIDSPEAEEYNVIRKGADFCSVYDNVVNLQRKKAEKNVRKPELGIEFVAMKKNFCHLPKLMRLAWELNAAQVVITNLLPYHESMKDEIVYDIDDTGCLFGMDSVLAAVRAQMANMRLRTERHCKFVKDKALCINHLGNVSPCYALMHSYECFIYGRKKSMLPLYFGNVNEKTLESIWRGKEYFIFRHSVLNYNFPSCTDCRSLEGCNYTDSNETDCWANSPSCADCLWSRNIIVCP